MFSYYQMAQKHQAYGINDTWYCVEYALAVKLIARRTAKNGHEAIRGGLVLA